MRSNKIHAGLQLLVAPITVKLNNLSAMEINTIRPFFQGSLDRFYSLSQVWTLNLAGPGTRLFTQWTLTPMIAAQMEDNLHSTQSTDTTQSQSQSQPQLPRQLRRPAP